MEFLVNIRKYCHYLLTIFLLWAPHASAQDLQLYEQEIKAGLLYNFLKYTNWSNTGDTTSEVNLCIFGSNPFNDYLKPMEGRSVNRRVIIINNIYSAQDTKNCHLLFVNANRKDEWPQLRNLLAGQNILTVSDIQGFSKNGGMIEFGQKNNRVNIYLNQDNMKAAHLSVQNRMLNLVTVVQGEQ